MAERATFGVGHLGQVVGRHGVGQHRLHADRRRQRGDALRRIEHDALGRDADALPHRLWRMAHDAARLDHVDHRLRRARQIETRGQGRLGGRRREAELRPHAGRGRHRQPERRPDRHGRRQPGPPRRLGRLLFGVPAIVEVAHQRAGDDHAGDDRRDRGAIGEGHRIVVGQHHEQDGQRDVIVVGRTLLGGLHPLRLGLAAGDQRRHRPARVGHDDQEDVGGHHRRHQRPGVDQRAAPGEDERVGVTRQHHVAEADQRQQRVVLAQRRLAKLTSTQVNENIKVKTKLIAEALSAYEHIRSHIEKAGKFTYNGKEYTRVSTRSMMASIKHEIIHLPVEIKILNRRTRIGKLSEDEVTEAINRHLAEIGRAVQTYYPAAATQLSAFAKARYDSEKDKFMANRRGPKIIQALVYISDQLVGWLNENLAGTQVHAAMTDVVLRQHVSAPSLTMSLMSYANNVKTLKNTAVPNRIRTSGPNTDATQRFFGSNNNTYYTYNGTAFPPAQLEAWAIQQYGSVVYNKSIKKKLENQDYSALQRLGVAGLIKIRKQGSYVNEPAITSEGYLNAAGMILSGFFTFPRELLAAFNLKAAETLEDNKQRVLALQEFVSYSNAQMKGMPASPRSGRRSPRSPRR